MRFIPFIVGLLLVVGCSSGGNVPTSPGNETTARVALSEPYMDGSDSFVDLNVDSVPSLYQFSMRLEFNPDCVEFVGFEPSRDFGIDPLMVAERVKDLPSSLAGSMTSASNSLIALALSRKDPSAGDIKTPHLLGRIRYRNKCAPQKTPFTIFNRDDFLIFRDHLRNRIRMHINDSGSIGNDGGRS